MDDLIYSFLLQSGYPRSSIVFNMDLLGSGAQVSSGMKVPTFVVVDPDSADPLAVIEVVDSVDLETLKQIAVETGAYASRLAGRFVQGFVIRVDVRGRSEAEQVQFYRIWPNSTLQQLSSKNFPDLDSLRVSRKLVVNTTAMAVESMPTVGSSADHLDEDSLEGFGPSEEQKSMNAGLYMPAIVLLLLVFADGMFSTFKGESFLSVSQSILVLGAAALLTVPSAIRYSRQ